MLKQRLETRRSVNYQNSALSRSAGPPKVHAMKNVLVDAADADHQECLADDSIILLDSRAMRGGLVRGSCDSRWPPR